MTGSRAETRPDGSPELNNASRRWVDFFWAGAFVPWGFLGPRCELRAFGFSLDRQVTEMLECDKPENSPVPLILVVTKIAQPILQGLDVSRAR